MANYRVYGTTRENGSLTGNLVIAYKANRADFATAGQELGRALATPEGNFEILFTDWPYEVLVVALDVTDTVKYEAVIEDWVIPEYIGTDPLFDDVKVLMHMEGTNGGTSFIDVKGNGVVPIGEANTSTVQAKFGSSSLALDGTDDRLEIANNVAFDIATGDWCLELWVYQTDNTGYQVPATNRHYSVGAGYGPFLLRIFDGTLQFYCGRIANNSWINDTTAGTVPTNQWVHIALTRNGSFFKAFIDGVETGSATDAGDLLSSGYPIYLGSEFDGVNAFIGYMDEFRFTVGDARYTQNFVPPQQPFVDTVGDLYFNYVKSLMHMEGIVSGTTFVDEIGNVATAYGATNTSSTQFKFGSTSARFDGATDYISIDHHPDMLLGTKDFTIEGWFWWDNANTDSQTMFAKRDLSSQYGSFVAYQRYYDLYIYFRTGTSAWTSTIANNCFSSTTWHHVAITRESGRLKGFVDGVTVFNIPITQPILDDTYNIYLGSSSDGVNPTTGYIDEFRYTVGYARYTEDFSIPASAFPNS